MTLNEYQLAALRTAPEGVQPYHHLLHGAMGVASEAGEILDIVKKHHAYGREIDLVHLREEVGDALWFLALLCEATGTTLDQVAYKNLAKLRARFPDKFDAVQALNRNLQAERIQLEKA